jgi:hypothetical protein
MFIPRCSDFESTQHQSVSVENPERKKHNVNFVAAHVLCTHCMRNGRWRLPMGQLACYICGDARTITFSVRTHHTQVDRKEVYAEPLDQFVNWLIYELPAQYKTIAFSHFGGRYGRENISISLTNMCFFLRYCFGFSLNNGDGKSSPNDQKRQQAL